MDYIRVYDDIDALKITPEMRVFLFEVYSSTNPGREILAKIKDLTMERDKLTQKLQDEIDALKFTIDIIAGDIHDPERT